MQTIYDNGDGTCTMGGKQYDVAEELRGCRPKMWLHYKDPNGHTFFRTSHVLMKYSRNDVSCENYGEVLYYAFATSVGARCTKYELAKFHQIVDGKVVERECVICPTYFHKAHECEYSSYDLQRYCYLTPNCSNLNLQPNTVESLVSCASVLMDHPNVGMLRQCKRDLVKMAFLDYITGQTDRHWLNTTFIYRSDVYDNKTSEALRVASSYDNGCCFLFKRKEQALKTIANQLRVAKKTGDREKYNEILDNIAKKTAPCLGIYTSFYDDPDTFDRERPEKLSINRPDNWEEIFINELCAEIKEDSELRKFFRFKSKFSLSGAKDVLKAQGDTIPEDLMFLAGEIVDFKVSRVYEKLGRVLAEENNNGAGYEEVSNG